MNRKKNLESVILVIGTITFFMSLFFSQSLIGYSVAVFLGLYTLLNPKRALFILSLYFPIRPLITELNPGLKVLGDLIIVILFIRAVIICVRNNGFKAIFALEWFEWAFIIYAVFGSLVGLLHGVSAASVVFQFRAFMITYLLFYAVKRMDSFRRREWLGWLWFVFFIAVTICIHGLVEKLSLRTFLLPEAWAEQDLSPTNAIRIYGMAHNPNVLALFLGIAFMTTMFLRMFYGEGKNKSVVLKSEEGGYNTFKRVIIDIGLILITGVFLLTYSRGSMIAFAVVFIVYVVVSGRLKIIKPVVIYLFLAIFLVFYPANKAAELIQKQFGNHYGQAVHYTDRLTGTFSGQSIDQSVGGGRLYIVKKGFTIFQDHPVAGTGFGTFGDSAAHAFGSPIYKKYQIPRTIYTDNQYIEIIVQTGIIGVILFAVFLLGMLRVLWKNRGPFVIPLVALLIGAYVSGLYYNIWEDKAFTLFFFMMFGLIYSRGSDPKV
ncbi:O-antigen ligase [Scopulibacillus darangshiensis]|uniref:O-antigen ligase n=1 Tax=Scopulibacillus darangshiensis TaxID=442528 RepID=A0A4R2NVN9_9BACL|nr:O-antigen ligase family protein [Scopulibacillus darangshiensis]TCP26012.1 O-antigen ligase [Scopulibacillus darangshiensis]